MKRLILLCLCAALLAGYAGQKDTIPETTASETESAASETETAAETETEPAESETEETESETKSKETEAETVSDPAAAREITLDPAAKGYIYVYTYPSPTSPDYTMYYCTDTPLAGSDMDGTQKEKPDGITFATDTRLPSALESETAENTTPTADDIATLTLRDVISCTAEYPEYAYVSRDSYSDGYLFYHDSTWMAYRLTDGTTLPITHAEIDPAAVNPNSFEILRGAGKMYPGYVFINTPGKQMVDYVLTVHSLYSLKNDEMFLEDVGYPDFYGNFLEVSSYDNKDQVAFFDLSTGELAGIIEDIFPTIQYGNGKFYILAHDKVEETAPYSIYNDAFTRIGSANYNQLAVTTDGYGVVINADNTGYRIFDTDGTTIAENTGFDQVIKLYNNCDYVCVAANGWIQFRKMHDGSFLTNLCTYDVQRLFSDDRQYYFHPTISGYLANGKSFEYTVDYADATPNAEGKYDYSVERFAVNTGTLEEPKFTIERFPEALPSGVYIMVEDPNIPELIFPDDGTSHTVEYYLTDNGDLYRIETDFMGGYAKPVLYLYPDAETEVSVSFAHPESLTTVYPAYPDGGWKVVAQPDGTLRTVSDGAVSERTYYALYWEESGSKPCDFSTGFCVAKEDSAQFLEDSLAALGFTDREANECILYWLPILEKSPYNLVSFELTQSREDYNALRILPKPDSVLRVALHILPVTEPVEIEAQVLPTFDRHGFTAVEWGGVYGG